MSDHGINVLEDATALAVPVTAGTVQVVIGTAPVNLVGDPSAVVNTPILANSAQEAMAELGFSDSFQEFTLCQSMYITGNAFPVGPVVYINVLNPATHNKTLADTTVQVNNKQAVVEKTGILVDDNLVVKAGSNTLQKGTDYTTAVDKSGYLVITLIQGGAGASATSLTVSGKQIDPSAVTASDIIGTVNASTGEESGIQAIRQVYPKLGVVPSLALAPGWSQNPTVGSALAAAMANINGCFKGMALVDLDTSTGKARKYDAENDDVPFKSPSNEMLGVTGQCLADGTEVTLDQDQGTTVNSYGVATAININGWRLWGNYTGAYPASTDAKDIWFPVRRMFNWQGNNFILTYFDKVDDPMNRVLIESIVDSENIRCAAFAPDKWAGARIEYRADDNPATSILAGKVTFRQFIAPYTPAQEITDKRKSNA